jgi:hypothetical protein
MSNVIHLLDTDTPEHLANQIFQFLKEVEKLDHMKRHAICCDLDKEIDWEWYADNRGQAPGN